MVLEITQQNLSPNKLGLSFFPKCEGASENLRWALIACMFFSNVNYLWKGLEVSADLILWMIPCFCENVITFCLWPEMKHCDCKRLKFNRKSLRVKRDKCVVRLWSPEKCRQCHKRPSNTLAWTSAQVILFSQKISTNNCGNGNVSLLGLPHCTRKGM